MPFDLNFRRTENTITGSQSALNQTFNESLFRTIRIYYLCADSRAAMRFSSLAQRVVLQP
jgi:hypothetical protein